MRYGILVLAAAVLAAPSALVAAPKAVKPAAQPAAKTTAKPAAKPAPDAVDGLVREAMQKRAIPGVAVAIVRDGKAVFSRAYGMADLELAVPARTDHLFEIGSVTKQFTAVAVMQLVEAGKVKLDAPATDYLKDLPEAWKAVTVRHLLTHTGGVPNYTAEPSFSWTEDYTPDKLLALVKDKPLEYAPGERMAYSNTGYYLLGRLIEAVSGQPYGEYLRDRVLGPAGMTHTRLSGPDVIRGRAHGYGGGPAAMVNAPRVLAGGAGAAGAILSSVEDMAKWDAALYTERLLKKASFDQMWTPTRLNGGTESTYAFGWDVSQQKGRRVLAHGGGTAGFSSMVIRVAPENVTAIVLANTGAGAADPIARALIGHYIPDLKPEPPAAPPATDPDPARTERVKSIVLGLLSEIPDTTPLNDEMRKAMTPEMLAGMRQQMAMIGPLKSLAYLGDTETPQGHVYRYRATFGTMPLVLTATFDKDKKVAGLFVRPE